MLVTPNEVPCVIEQYVDDDRVLPCTMAAGADLIVSGDKHLLGLGGAYQSIRITTPTEAARIIEAG